MYRALHEMERRGGREKKEKKEKKKRKQETGVVLSTSVRQYPCVCRQVPGTLVGCQAGQVPGA